MSEPRPTIEAPAKFSKSRTPSLVAKSKIVPVPIDPQQVKKQLHKESDPSLLNTRSTTGASYIKLCARNENKFLVDPDFSKALLEKIDERVKFMFMVMMFCAIMIWGVLFFCKNVLPQEIFAYKEIKQVFLPPYYWTGIYTLIVCPWISSLYGLFLVVYPDPRKWKMCCRPRRYVRWIPYISTLLYTVVVNSYWLHSLFLIPGNLNTRMKAEIMKIVKNPSKHLFSKSWAYIHNYYQCCGMEAKEDWRNKLVPKNEYPHPFKNDACSGLKYGVVNPETSQCSSDTMNTTELGIVWPASCCNNMTLGCTTLPTSNQVWRGNCLHSEISMAISAIVVVMLLSMTINTLGVVTFFKTKVLESYALHQRLEPPKPHI